jgi:hypothetical protein
MQEPLQQNRVWDGLAQLGLMAALLFVAATFKHYGISWDEPLHLENGWRALNWYLTLGQDRSVLHFQNLYLYGALYDAGCALASLVLPFDGYETRRLLGGLVGVLGLAAVRLIARELGGARAGALAVLLLLLTPEWIGQSFANPKDIPFAAAAAWVAYAQLRLLREPPRYGHWLLHGVAFGCALGIRVGGVILLAPLLIGLGVQLVQSARRDGLAPTTATALRLCGPMLASLVLSWALMVAFWPWAQTGLLRPLEALAEFSHFPLSFHFPFAGQDVETTALPNWYVPVAFAVKLAEPALMGLLVVLVLTVRSVLRHGWDAITPVRIALASMIAVPPALVIGSHAVLYDGIRHLLFLLVPLCVAAGLGLDQLGNILANRGLRPVKAGAVLLMVWSVWQMVTIGRLHPYEAIWYNALAGGVKGAEGRFELDIGGTALSEAAMRLRDHVVSQEGSWALAHPYRIRVCGPPESALYYLPPRWIAPPDGQGPADFYISFTRSHCPGEPKGKQILRVRRMGVTLAYVLDLRPIPTEEVPENAPVLDQP